MAIAEPAFAAAGSDQGEGKNAATGAEDIVVTAQRRSERLQDVPISIAALTSTSLDQQGISGMEDLQHAVPGLVFSGGLNSATPFLRGVGTPDTTPGAESSIATYVDGIYYPAMPGTIFALANIERIEVLKGPQGTLFGRNATGGLIQVITRDPPRDFSGQVKLGYGNYQTFEASGYLGGGIAPNLALDFAGYYNDQGKGWGVNPTVNQEANFIDETQLRSKLVYDNGTTVIRLSLDYSYRSSDRGSAFTFLPGARGVGGFASVGLFNPINNVAPGGHTEQYGAALSIQQPIGSVKFTSLTSVRRLQTFLNGDLDNTPTPSIDAQLNQFDRDFTQELQLASSGTGPFQWIGGLYFMDRKAGFNPFLVLRTRSIEGFQRTRSLGAYAEASYEFLPATKLTLGVRYTSDRQTIDATVSPLAPATGSPVRQAEKVTFGKVTWRAVLDTKINPDLLLYASFNRGFKSGGYNVQSPGPTNTPVRPKVLDAFEAGFKWGLLDNRLKLNASAFHYNYRDIQLQQVTTIAITLNAARASVTGIDFDASFAPADGLSFGGGAVYMPEAKYTDFKDAPFSVPRVTAGVPTGGNLVTKADATGHRMIRSPKLTLNLYGNYETAIGNDTLAFNVAYTHNSGFPWEADNRVYQSAYDTVNGSISYTFAKPGLTVRFWGKNLTDTVSYVQVSESLFGDRGRPAAPRTYGFSLEKKF